MGKLYLYSTNPRVAYMISKEYFGNVFYVYAAEQFDERNNRHSSRPITFYRAYREIVKSSDIYNERYLGVIGKIKKEAKSRLKKGSISPTQYQEIIDILNSTPTQIRLFIPVIYIIDITEVEKRRGKLKSQRYKGGAGQRFGREYFIPDLQREEFEAIAPDLIDDDEPIDTP